MDNRIVSLAFSFGCFMMASTASATTEAGSPGSAQPWMKTVVEKERELATRKIETGTPGEAKWQTETKALIDDMLDWPEMTQQTLGRHWEKLSAPEQKEFAGLLREMIEASYQSKLKLLARGQVKKPETVKIEWLEEKLEGNESAVAARVKTNKNSATLQMRAKFKEGRWRIWDVAIDEVSTVRTYRSQFGKIIGQDGFPALVARMKSKIEEIRAGRAELGP